MGKLIRRYLIDKIVFFVCLVSSICLLVAGFILPPIGIIDNSVLKACGELLGFTAAWFCYRAVIAGKYIKAKKGDLEVSVGVDDDEFENEKTEYNET